MIHSMFFLLLLALKANCENLHRTYHNSKILITDDNVVNVTIQGKSTQFFTIGDWGGLPVFPYRTIVEQTVSSQMAKFADHYQTQFQLALGDNFYFNGVKDVNDKRFKETFEQVFDDKRLQNPWFVLMGNHDHYGNASAQIDYFRQSQRWILPDYNYTVNVKIDNGTRDLIHIIMLDTVMMCGNSGYDVELKQPRMYTLNERLKAQDYFNSLEQHLASIADSPIPYIIVAGHFPVWSVAEHGPTKCLVDRLRPLLHKYSVSAYLCGHDHNLQHISDNFLDSQVEYFVIGSSNFVQNSTEHADAVPPGSLKYFWADDVAQLHGGLAVLEANDENLKVTFFKSDGRTLYQKTIKPRKI